MRFRLVTFSPSSVTLRVPPSPARGEGLSVQLSILLCSHASASVRAFPLTGEGGWPPGQTDEGEKPPLPLPILNSPQASQHTIHILVIPYTCQRAGVLIHPHISGHAVLQYDALCITRQKSPLYTYKISTASSTAASHFLSFERT